jgi:hypothetical protein
MPALRSNELLDGVGKIGQWIHQVSVLLGPLDKLLNVISLFLRKIRRCRLFLDGSNEFPKARSLFPVSNKFGDKFGFPFALLCNAPFFFFSFALLFPLPSFALHLQFHLRILFEDLRVSLAKPLCEPLVGCASGTQSRGIRGSKVVDSEVGNLGPPKSLVPDRLESGLVPLRFRSLGNKNGRSPALAIWRRRLQWLPE